MLCQRGASVWGSRVTCCSGGSGEALCSFFVYLRLCYVFADICEGISIGFRHLRSINAYTYPR